MSGTNSMCVKDLVESLKTCDSSAEVRVRLGEREEKPRVVHDRGATVALIAGPVSENQNIYIVRTERHLDELESTQVYHDAISASTAIQAEDMAWERLVNEAAGFHQGEEEDISYDRDALRVSYEGEYDYETHTIMRVTRISGPEDVLKAMAGNE